MKAEKVFPQTSDAIRQAEPKKALFGNTLPTFTNFHEVVITILPPILRILGFGVRGREGGAVICASHLPPDDVGAGLAGGMDFGHRVEGSPKRGRD